MTPLTPAEVEDLGLPGGSGSPGGSGGSGPRAAWDRLRAAVVGLDRPGFAAADNLTHLGARVTVLDAAADAAWTEQATLLEILGATVLRGTGVDATLPDEIDVVVVSPSVDTDAPAIRAARERDVPVWGEADLAWRLRDPDRRQPWIGVTGGRSTDTVTRVLESMLRRGGASPLRTGADAVPLVEAVMDPAPYDVLVVGLTAQALRDTRHLACESGAVVEVGPTPDGWTEEAYAAALGRIYENVERACVYNVADRWGEDLVREADVVEGARAIGVTLGVPAVGMVGLVEDVLADRAFVEQRHHSAAELGTLADLAVPTDSAESEDAAHVVLDALVAAALARAHGVSPAAVRDGLREVLRDGR